MENIGKTLVIIGAIIVVAGLLIWLMGGKFGWIGNLPGDVKIERKNFTFHAPVASMLLISIVISAVLYLISRFFR